MSEDYLIRHCAPTLAGLKTGSLFPCPFESKDALLSSLRSLNRRLQKKGLRILPLRFAEKKALIYVYRPGKLRADLSDDAAATLLRRQGYDPENCTQCLVQLARKLRLQEAFPHEIGLFIGYPPEDVHGFMTDCRACKCVGCWKVYGDEAAAKKKFAQYKKCTRVYCDRWAQGRPLEQLTVAC